jgi:glycosyl transferase, family 25
MSKSGTMDVIAPSNSPVSIDAVVVINLDHRSERWDAFQQQTAGIIPAEKLHRISAVAGVDLPGYGTRPWFRGRKRDTTWAARGGCVLSHRRALEQAREKGWKNVLVMEDDAVFEDSFLSLTSHLERIIAAPDDSWQVCYFGYTDPWPPYLRIQNLNTTHTLEQVFGCNTTHAYLVKTEARDWILASLPQTDEIWNWLSRHRAIDRWYCRHLGRRFVVTAISPSAINQAAGFSDIVNRATDYATTGAHLLQIPKHDQTDKNLAASIRTWIRRLRLLPGDCYDACRGLIKRRRGF